MHNSVIEDIYNNFSEVIKYIEESKNPSLNTWLKSNFAKVLILSVASYFEFEIIQIIVECAEKTCQNKKIFELVKNRINSREYSKLFDWNSINANRFLALFGQEFRSLASQDIQNSSEIEEGVKAFMELGSMRNELVHTNLGGFSLNNTPEEIYEKYNNAIKFIEYFRTKLNQ